MAFCQSSRHISRRSWPPNEKTLYTNTKFMNEGGVPLIYLQNILQHFACIQSLFIGGWISAQNRC